jgi:hypothetical protein
MNSCLYNYCLFSWPFQKLDIKVIKGNWNIAVIGISNRPMRDLSTNQIFYTVMYAQYLILRSGFKAIIM